MNLNTVWRCAQYRRVQWGVMTGIWLSAGVVFWCFYLQPAAGETEMRRRQLQQLTALSEQAVPETVILPPPDIPPLLQMTLHLALPGADSPDPEKEWHDDE